MGITITKDTVKQTVQCTGNTVACIHQIPTRISTNT